MLDGIKKIVERWIQSNQSEFTEKERQISLNWLLTHPTDIVLLSLYKITNVNVK
jgi:hypothetical protein